MPIIPSVKVRVNNIDYAIIPNPDHILDQTSLPRVPVIRIFGESTEGVNACVHVHQVYPYFYTDYHGSMDPDYIRNYIRKLTTSLNRALAVTLHRKHKPHEWRYVRAIILTKGVPFYGFHTSYEPYLKILLCDPSLVNRAANILRGGSVMKTVFKTHEVHLGYILQFMIDFGLYGCGWMEIGQSYIRRDSDDYDVISDPRFKTSPLAKVTWSKLELDIISHQILNRHLLLARPLSGHFPVIPEPSSVSSTSSSSSSIREPLIQSVRELWEDERQRRIKLGLNPTPAFPTDDTPRGKGENWRSEERFRAEIDARILKETGNWKERRPETWQDLVMTTFDSVQALWTSEWNTWAPPPGAMPHNQKSAEGLFVVQDDISLPSLSSQSNPFQPTQDVIDGDHDLQELEVDLDETLLSSQKFQPFLTDEELQGLGRDEWEKIDHGAESSADDDVDSDLNIDRPEPVTPSKRKIRHSISRSSASPPATPTNSTAAFPPGNQEMYARQLRTPTKAASSSHVVVASFPDNAQTPAGTDALITQLFTPMTQDLFQHRPTKRRRVGFNSSSQFTNSPITTSSIPSQDTTIPVAGVYTYSIAPPITDQLLSTIETYGLPAKIYRDPYYSKASDVPRRPREHAGRIFRLTGGSGLKSLKDWDPSSVEPIIFKGNNRLPTLGIGGWEYSIIPPSLRECRGWLNKHPATQEAKSTLRRPARSQIIDPTQATPYVKSNAKSTSTSSRIKQNMTILSIEIFACSRGRLLPDPEDDTINAVFYTFQSAVDDHDDRRAGYYSGVIAVSTASLSSTRQVGGLRIDLVDTENDLINKLIDQVLEWDPDVLCGWEIQGNSWGYLADRVKQYGGSLSDMLCRIVSSHGRSGGDSDWERTHTSTFKVPGRHVLNLWRIIRAEQSYKSYTFENVVFQLLQRRVPRYSVTTLTEWYKDLIPAHTARVFSYFVERTATVIDLIDEVDVITKNAEFARVFGIDFFSVLSRGSQYKVEAFMFRIAKPENFVLLSPSREEVGAQNAAECIPLIMEPQSQFYKSPLLVLDFQSLYPSIMIAYNYCYSTCLGRIGLFKGQSKLGVTEVKQPPGVFEQLKDHVHVAANGIVYAKTSVRKSLLAKMLEELLETRIMVKQAMKTAKGDKSLLKLLDARQLSLKLICNVTYGYTSASFSGRMPCVEIADSIVQSGRETLEKSIELIERTPQWGAKVVYGDTDSLFVSLPGKTKTEAFRIGQDMADRVTALNPRPIKLKFEKVYLPCVLMAKKRYVGFKYETPDDAVPVFDAKGIETVRRDGIPAGQKMLETCLKMLFRSQDLSEIKDYCYDCWTKLLEGKVSPQDFVFAKEVKLGSYSENAIPMPGAMVAARRMEQDPRDEALYGDRVPYVITRGESKRQVDRACGIDQMFWREGDPGGPRFLDAEYYITKQLIPPLARVFDLVGADIVAWYNDMPRIKKVDKVESIVPWINPQSPTKAQKFRPSKGKIDQHFRSLTCVNCGQLTQSALCPPCRLSTTSTIYSLINKLRNAEGALIRTQLLCGSCTSTPSGEQLKCESYDCSWLYERYKAETELDRLRGAWAFIQDIAGMNS